MSTVRPSTVKGKDRLRSMLSKMEGEKAESDVGTVQHKRKKNKKS